MCCFITGVRPDEVNISLVRRLGKAVLRRWDSIANPSVATWLLRGGTYYLTTAMACDCGPVVGCAHDPIAPSRLDRTDEQVKSLLRRGWRPKQIERRLRQRAECAEQRARAGEQRLRGREPEVARWLEFLRTVIGQAIKPSISLLAQWHRGTLEDEAIPIVRREVLRPSELVLEGIMCLEREVLYDFRG